MMVPKTDEQIFWWRQGVLAMLAENARQYASCKGKPDDPHACQTFDCLGAAVTTDQINRIKNNIWPQFIMAL